MPSGKLSTYTEERADKVIEALCEGKTLAEAAKNAEISSQTVAYWWYDNAQFFEKCTRAQVFATELAVDELNNIARDEPDVNRARLQCDNIKWTASKRHAMRYGDRIDLTITQQLDIKGALHEASNRALLPGRFQDNAVEAEYTEIKGLNDKRTTDCESVGEVFDPSIDIFS